MLLCVQQVLVYSAATAAAAAAVTSVDSTTALMTEGYTSS
jgi:hypothetical protein